MTRQVFHNAVIGVLQIALVAKSNILYFNYVGAITKKCRSTIIITYIMLFFDLVAGFGSTIRTGITFPTTKSKTVF